jgi:hypothetical protein
MVFGLMCLALYAWQRFGSLLRERIGWTAERLPVDEGLVLYAISVPVAALAVWTMMVAGHSGATLVWKATR